MRGLKMLNALIACAGAILMAVAIPAGAQTYTWTGTADGNWSEPLNWAGGVPVGGAGTVVQFNAIDPVSFTSTNDLPDNPFVLNGLTFSSSSTGLVTLSTNNPFQFAGANPGINMMGSGAAVISSGSGGFIFDAATNPFTIGGARTGTLTLGGQTDNNVLTGAGAVTVNFATIGSPANPNLMLGNVGSWTGNLNIQSGYVQANRIAGDLFGNSTILSVAAGSTFDFNNNGESFGGLQGAGTIILGSAGMQFLAPGDRSWTGSISGTGGVDQGGGGVFLLGGNNSYTGNTTVSGGVIRAAGANVLSAASVVAITAGQGGVLDLNNFDQTVAGLTGGQVTSAGVTLGSATLTVNNTGTRVYNGFISGTGGLIVSGTGTQILTGQNTYTGATTVNGGTLRMQGAGLQLSSGVTIAAGATLDANFDANANWTTALSGAGVLSKSGVGSVTFSAANLGANLSGLTVNNGAVVLDYTGDTGNKIGSNPALTLGTGALNLLGNGSAATNQNFNGLSLTGGAGKINVTTGNNQNASVAVGAITRSVGSTINFGLTNTGGGVASISTTAVNNSNGIIGGWATINGSDWAVSGTGAGPFNVSALPAASYVSNTLTAGTHADVTSSFVAPSGRTTATVRFNTAGANTLTLAGTNNVTNGGLLVTPNVGANTSTITGGTVTAPANQELFVNQFNAAGDLAIASVVGNTNGTAVVQTVGNLGTGATITVPSTAGIVPGMLVTAGTNIPTSANAHVVSVNSPTSVTISFITAPVAGSGVPVSFTPGTSLVKSGSGTLVLSGTNTFTGPLVLNEGVVSAGVIANLGASAATGSSSIIFNGGTLRMTGNIAPGSGIQPWVIGPNGGTIDIAGANTTTSKQGNSVFGTGPLTKIGDGVFSVGSNLAAFSGPINISQGVLRLTSNQLRNSIGMTVANGAQLYVLDTANAPFNVAAGGSLVLNGDGPGGTGAYRHALDEVGSATNGAWNSPVILQTTSRLTVSTQGTLANRTPTDVIIDTFAFPITGPGNLIKDGDGTLILSNGFNKYGGSNGSTIVSNGLLKIAVGNDRLPTNTTLQFGENGSTNSGTFDLNGFNQTVAGLTTAGAGTGHQVVNSGANPSVLTVNYNGATAQTYGGSIGGIVGGSPADNLSLVKTGTGTLTLTGNNTYTGPTTVQGGTLRVLGNAVARPYVVADGAGLDVVNTDPATPFQMSTLTLGASSASALTLELTAATLPTSGVVNVNDSNGLTANGKVNVAFSSVQPLAVGTIPLVKYNGTLQGAGFAAFSGGTLTLPSRVLGSLVNNTANSSIDLNVTGVDFVKWNGNVSGDWNVNTSANWKLASNSAATTYLENPAPGDTVVFDDTAAGTKTINLTTTLKPSAVTVNAAANYMFSGPGKLSGPTGLTKSGSGTLTVTTNNDNTGLTTVSGGTLQIGNGGTAGALGGGNIVNDATVIFNRADDVTIGSNISGNGSFTKNGAGTLSVNGSYSQGGVTTIAAGALALNGGGINAGAVTGSGTLVKGGTGTLVLAGASAPGAGTNVIGGTLQIGNGGTTGTLAGNVALATGTTLAFNRTDDSVYAGGISGPGGLANTGTGKIALTGPLSYSGQTDVGVGTVEFGSATDFTAAGKMVGTGNIIKSGAGQLTLLSTNTFTGTFTVNQGTALLADLGGSGDLNAANLVINTGGKFIFGQGGIAGENPDFPDSTFIDINGGEYEIRVGEQWGATRLRNGGIYRINGSNGAVGSTFNATSGAFTGLAMESGTIIAQNTGTGSGTLTLGAGVSAFSKTTAGTITVVGKVSFQAAAAINLQEGTLSFDATNVTTGGGTIALGTSGTSGVFQMTGPGAGSTNRPFDVTAGAFDVADAGGTLTLTGTLGNSGPLAKTGPGTLVVTPQSGYSGTTTVQGGTLRLNPGTAGGGFAVAGGGAKLAIAPGASLGTVGVPTLALADGSVVSFELDTTSTPTAPLLAVANTDGLTRTGATHTLALSNPQALPVGQFTLIDYDGAAITSGFTLGNLPARAAGGLVYNTANTSIDLNITGVDSTLWNGNLSANWDAGTAADVGGTPNFKLASNGNATNFIAGDRITFDDTAVGASTVNLTTTLQPASITVNNSVKNYTFQGTGSIAGTTGLVKQGTGSLTILTDNTYTGATAVSGGGTLQLGNGGTTGSITGPVSVDSGAALIFNRSNDLTYNGAITGFGNVNKTGAGTLTLGGSSQFSGTFTVDQGKVVLDDLGGGGDLFATDVVINNGATFVFGENGNPDFPDTTNVTVNAGGLFDLKQGENFGGVTLKGGTFQMTGTTRAGINATGAANGGFNLESGNIITSFTGAATGGVLAGSTSLNKTTPGTVTVDGGVSFGTAVTINIREGVLAMPAASFPAGGTTTVTLGDSSTTGTLRVTDAASAFSERTFDVAPGGGVIDVAAAGGSITLTGDLTDSGTFTKAGPGTLNLSGATTFVGATVVSGGKLAVTGSLANSTGITINASGTYEAGSTQLLKSATINAGGLLRIATGAQKALTIGDNSSAAPLAISGGKLDLTTNGLIVRVATGAESAAFKSVRNQIVAGYNATGAGNNGDFNGNGIVSSNAAADRGKAVGYAMAGELPSDASGQFLGQAVDPTSIVVRYTLAGDATLDGTVDFNDLVKLAQNYNTTVSTSTDSWWTHGDFTYDGVTDFNDLVKLAQNYNTALLPAAPVPGASAAFEADLARAFASAAVPEPSSVAVVTVVVALMGCGKRRR